MDDFDALIKDDSRDMKVILDLVLNHTADASSLVSEGN